MHWNLFPKKGAVGGMDDEELAGMIGSAQIGPVKPVPAGKSPNELYPTAVEEYEEEKEDHPAAE